MNPVVAFAICIVIWWIGTAMPRYTKGIIGASMFSVIVFLLGFWLNIMPADIGTSAYLPQLYAIAFPLIVVQGGTCLKWAELKKNWKIVIITTVSCLGMIVTIRGIGGLIVGSELSTVGLPILMGGLVSGGLMRDAALAAGLEDIAGIAVIMISVQSWFGMPLMSWGARKASLDLIKDYREKNGTVGNNVRIAPNLTETAARRGFYDRMPRNWNNEYYCLAIAALVYAVAAVIGGVTAKYTMNIVDVSIVAMILGFLASNVFHILPYEPITRAGLMSFCLFCMIMNFRGGLATLTPAVLLRYAGPLVLLAVLGIIGALVPAWLLHKKFRFSFGLLVACVMGVYAGYPVNYQCSIDGISSVATSEEEAAYLREKILPSVVVSGTVSVGLYSILVANICKQLLGIL